MIYKKKRPLIVLLVPGLLFMVIFLYKPFFENILNSFFEMSSVVKLPGVDWDFIGLDNYKRLFTDPKIRIAIKNSFIMMILAGVFQVGIAFVLAALMNSINKGQKFFRVVYFFPIVISATAIGLICKLFYNYNGGMLNQILGSLGYDPIHWLSRESAYIMVAIPTIWSYVGFYFVIILTAIKSVPEDLFEAAAIDGASKFQQVYYITIPMIKGTLSTCIILSVTGALKVFDLPWVIVPKGAPQGVTHFLGTYMYEQAFVISNIDYGSTISLVIVIFGVLVSKGVSVISDQLEKFNEKRNKRRVIKWKE